MGVRHGSTPIIPIARWMVYMESENLLWMTGATPMTFYGHLHCFHMDFLDFMRQTKDH